MRERRNKRSHFLKKIKLIVSFFLLVTVLTGCIPMEEPHDRLIIAPEDTVINNYTLAVVGRGDVLLTKDLRCTYEELYRQELSFSVGGKIVQKVYVSQGDHVKKGQILAELSNDGIDDKVKNLEYQIARNQIYLDNAQINEDYEISTLWLQFMYQSGQTQAERNALMEAVEKVQQRYRYEREDYELAVKYDTMVLKELRKEAATSKLYAELDGVVTFLQTGLEGTVSVQDRKIMEISNDSECIFVVNETEYASYFEEGVPVEMEFYMGANKGTYRIMPYQPEKWTKEQLLFTLAEDPGRDLEPSSFGRITLLLEERKDVLCISKSAVHVADEKSFVYRLNEENLREVVWVETGLYGNDTVEILSGLEEGEWIIQ